jgi:hypothetical protein
MGIDERLRWKITNARLGFCLQLEDILKEYKDKYKANRVRMGRPFMYFQMEIQAIG